MSYVVSAILILLVIIWLSDLNLIESFYLAADLSGPAPSVAIPIIRNLDLKRFARVTITTESALGETLSILMALAILDWLRLPNVDYGKMVGALFSSFALALAIGAACGFLWSLLLTKVRQLKNAMFTTPAVVFIVYGVCDFVGYSGPVAALAFGITIGNASSISLPQISHKINLNPIHLNEPEKMFLAEIVFLAKTFFFVYLGLSLEFTSPNLLILAIALTVTLLFARTLAVRLSIRRHIMPAEDAAVVAALVPKGLAAAVLAILFAESALYEGETVQKSSMAP